VTQRDILERAAAKGADVGAIAEELIGDSRRIPMLIDALRIETGSKRFAYEKVLRRVSEKQPALMYPYFDFFAGRLDHENSFLKWGAIMTVANLTAADAAKKFEALFRRYYEPIGGPVMITAANIIGSSVRIAGAKPALVDAITDEILKVEKAKYMNKGRRSPECRNVAIGHALDVLDRLFDQTGRKTEVLHFVRRQLRNTRKPVAGKAERFLRRHDRSRKIGKGGAS
jgi:hypothetical protein